MPQILTPYTLHLTSYTLHLTPYILHLTSYILYHTSSPAFSIKQNHYLWSKILKTMKLLLLSNSTNPGEDYLGWPREILADFIRVNNLKSCLFLPFAGVTVSWDDYTSRVRDVFSL